MGIEGFNIKGPKEPISRESLPELLKRFLGDENEKTTFDEVSIDFAKYAKVVGSVGMVGGLLLTAPTPAEARPQKSIEKIMDRFEKVNAPLTEVDIDILTRNVYREAGGEPALGQLAVLQVTLARALDTREEFGDGSIQGTVYKKNQFSWTRTIDEKADADMEASSAFKNLKAFIAFALTNRNKTEVVSVLSGLTGIRPDSLFYKRTDWDEHNPDEKRMSEATKKMFQSFSVEKSIGNHTFYNEK